MIQDERHPVRQCIGDSATLASSVLRQRFLWPEVVGPSDQRLAGDPTEIVLEILPINRSCNCGRKEQRKLPKILRRIAHSGLAIARQQPMVKIAHQPIW